MRVGPPAGRRRSDVTTSSAYQRGQEACRPRLHLVSPDASASAVRPPSGIYVRWGKTIVDRALALLLLVATAPVLALALVLVRLTLGPHVLLRQARVGKDGRVFAMYKVRTMLPDRRDRRDRRGGARGSDRRLCHKRDDDPRHTPLGRVLRKYSIDELPQLWNVLHGQMSLIGPRPELESVVEQYGLWDHPRHLVCRGITGPWQVSELRSIPLHENMHLDIDYVRELSWRSDLAVVRATAGALRSAGGH